MDLAASVKHTQDTLGTVVKRPPLTEKLLSRPPFRFLHDVISAVITETGYMSGLYTPDELQPDNIKDRDSKMAFLQKALDCAQFATGEPCSMRPAKTVAGQEAEKTNEFLQLLFKASQSSNGASAVQKVLDNQKPDFSSGGSADSNKENRQEKKEKRQSSKDSEKRSKEREAKSSNSKDATKRRDKAGAQKAAGPVANGDIKHDDDKRRSTDRKEKRPVESSSKTRSSSKDAKEKDRKDRHDKERKPRESSKEREKERKHRSGSKSKEVTSKETKAGTSKSSESRRSDKKTKQVDLDKPVDPVVATLSPRAAESPKSSKGSPKAESADKPEKTPPPEPEAAPVPAPQPVARPATAMRRGVPARPVSAIGPRPTTARPAPPRVRKAVEAPPEDQREGSAGPEAEPAANLITEDPAQQKEEEEFIVQETDETNILVIGQADPQEDVLDDEDHGGLVKKILETKKDLESGLEADDDEKRGVSVFDEKEREKARKDAVKLQQVLQGLTRTSHPLGRLLDFLQEDIDTMLKEIGQWKSEFKQNTLTLKQFEGSTASTLEPSRLRLERLGRQIAEQRQKIATSKANTFAIQERISQITGSMVKR